VLQPGPIALARGGAALRAEAVEGIVGEDIRVERLIPHGIGDDDVEGAKPAVRRLELGINHGVAARHLDRHVVNDRVHFRHGVAFGRQFLAIKLERHSAGGIEFARHQLQLDQQPGGAAGVVVAILPRLGAHDMRHEEADLRRREELPGALPRALGELAQQIFVGTAQKIWLHVGEP